MKIVYLSEYNEGGGAKSGMNLAVAASEYADVSLLGIGFDHSQYPAIQFIDTGAKRSLALRYILGVHKAMKRIQPDILHANGMYTGLLALVLRPFSFRDCKIIMTLRHTSTKMRFGVCARLLIQILNKVDVVHYLTTYQKNLYEGFGLKPHRFLIIPNIIYARQIDKSDADGLRKKLLSETSSTKLIVFVGRIVESKQVNLFIHVIEQLNLKGQNVSGIIVGSGNEAYIEKLKNLSLQIGVAEKIIFSGFTANPEIYIKAADFCLFPTQWDEALPRFIIESFSQSRTLVVSNHPSIQGIVSDAADVLIAPDHTLNAYTEKCMNLLNNPSLLMQLEAGAVNTYKTQYLSGNVITQYKDLYYSLCNPR
jgi:glycosyltransferase involved in cell wall biosynthesis